MIYFNCPSCREDLEADDAIRGTKMKCPACWQEIEVPQIGIKAPAGKGRAEKRGPARESSGSGLMIAIVVLIGTLALVTGAGIWFVMKNQPKPPAAPCTACKGSGLSTCGTCNGSKTQRCTAACQAGKIINSHNEPEDCRACNGTGSIACQICAGVGGLSCARCYGTKLEGQGRPIE